MTFFQRFLLYTGVMAVLFVVSGSWELASSPLIVWPLVVAVLFSYILERPWWLLIVWSVGMEMVSHLPAGTLTLAIFIPWLLLLWFKKPEHPFSFLFLGRMVLTVGLQIASILLFLSFSQGWVWPAVLLPLWLINSFLVFLAVAAWYEIVDPYCKIRTQPRFKQV